MPFSLALLCTISVFPNPGMSDITSSPSELDSVLFQLIILGHISTGFTSYTLVTNHVVIEISNTVGQTLCNSLPTTTCFSRVNIDWNNYADMFQILANYLNWTVQFSTYFHISIIVPIYIYSRKTCCCW
jgi:hypothetical protein